MKCLWLLALVLLGGSAVAAPAPVQLTEKFGVSLISNGAATNAAFAPALTALNASLTLKLATTLSSTAAVRYTVVWSFGIQSTSSNTASKSDSDVGTMLAVSLPSTGVLTAGGGSLSFFVNQSCSDFFTGLVKLRFLFQNAATDVAYDPVVVSFPWTCSKPGCKKCQHGTCIVPTGECVCASTGTSQWLGASCDYQLQTQSEVCPGDVLPIWYYIDGPLSFFEWWALRVGSNSISWWDANTMTQTADPFTPHDYLNRTLSLMPPPVPGSYDLKLFKKDATSSLMGQTPVRIKAWEECGFTAYNCSSQGGCAGAGSTCDAATGVCTCDSSRFGLNCSRGCDLTLTVYTDHSGTISSDPDAPSFAAARYLNGAHCSWNITPTEPNEFDNIVITFDYIDVKEGDKIKFFPDGAAEPSLTLAFMKDEGSEIEYPFPAKSLFVDFSTSYANIGRGFRLQYVTRKTPAKGLSAGGAVGIAVSGAFVLSVSVIAISVFVSRHNKKKREALQKLLAQPAGYYEAESEETALLAERSIEGTGVALNKAKLLFNIADSAPVPVLQELNDTFTISNDSGTAIDVDIFVPESGTKRAFNVQANPGHRTIQPGKKQEIVVKFTLNFTTRVATKIKVDVRSPKFGASVRSAFVSIGLEGALSESIDPDEILLDNKPPLGCGAAGTVYSGSYRKRPVAIKHLKDQDDMSEDAIDEFRKEVGLYKVLRSPLIVEFIGASMVPHRLQVCVELMPKGSLDDLTNRLFIPYTAQLRFAINIADAMTFLHSHNVIHRDLKLSNVMLVSKNIKAPINCKLADFGTAKNVDDISTPRDHTRNLGTPLFMAPELSGLYNNKVDVFAFAVSLWCMMCAKNPYQNISLWDIPKAVKAGTRPQIPQDCPPAYADLINACWAGNPQDRPEFKDIAASLKDLLAKAPVGKEPKKWKKRPTQPLGSTGSSSDITGGLPGMTGAGTTTVLSKLSGMSN